MVIPYIILLVRPFYLVLSLSLSTLKMRPLSHVPCSLPLSLAKMGALLYFTYSFGIKYEMLAPLILLRGWQTLKVYSWLVLQEDWELSRRIDTRTHFWTYHYIILPHLLNLITKENHMAHVLLATKACMIDHEHGRTHPYV